ncbi:unnamed protein product [Rotaria sp. Silwood2]|nr:unnamed protein product [Rotaria sp. Silwood2]
MTMDVVFHQAPIKLEAIVDHQHIGGLQLLVTELSQSQSENQTNFQVEVVINPETIPGHFHRTFLLRETSTSQQRSVIVNVRGKILREGQGTATLKHDVHMKSIITKAKEDEE